MVLKRVGLIYSTWSSKGVEKLRQTKNEKPVLTEHGKNLTAFYPDFTFCENVRAKRWELSGRPIIN